jgi:TP901-1 family phage major tail protein
MPLQISRDLALSIGDGGRPETFTRLTGLTARRFRLTAKLIETTDLASPSGWRELASGAGARGMTVTAQGALRSLAADQALRAAFAGQSPIHCLVTAPGLGVFAGPFLAEEIDYIGDDDGEATWSLTLASAGALSFTPMT